MQDMVVSDTLYVDVPYGMDMNIPVGTVFEVLKQQNRALHGDESVDSGLEVRIVSVPRPADRPVSAKMYPDNGYDRVVLDMPAEVAVRLRQVLGKIGGGYGRAGQLALDGGLNATHREQGTDLIWEKLEAQGI